MIGCALIGIIPTLGVTNNLQTNKIISVWTLLSFAFVFFTLYSSKRIRERNKLFDYAQRFDIDNKEHYINLLEKIKNQSLNDNK